MDEQRPAPTARPLLNGCQVVGCQVVQTRNGKVAATDHYFDLLTMLSQLGVTLG